MTLLTNFSVFSLIRMRWFGCHQQGHAGRKTLRQQNPPVLNWRCRLTQVDLYNGRKTVVVLVVLLTKLLFFYKYFSVG